MINAPDAHPSHETSCSFQMTVESNHTIIVLVLLNWQIRLTSENQVWYWFWFVSRHLVLFKVTDVIGITFAPHWFVKNK